jgi:hypothetical protein
MRRLHLVFGLIALVTFAATGRVMRTHTPPLHDLGDNVRLIYRSRHIYLLAGGVVNVLLGIYLAPARTVRGRIAQNVGSLLFLAAPVLLGAAFFVETSWVETGHGLSSHLWLSKIGLDSLLAGTTLHFLAQWAS